ncbi:hypothetical protein CONCODRAFT_11932 [Conidiobolus coronatus NRRL 28638]|uniref:Galactose oxidase n=1 Tax=Conidiobolus coronatus (strain ATCC 28846 / CBS 209.66 / NRRL 28638) TaxID=796925 RepID=A0A137NUI4_CONC2|nr:hypothetical protein CONCODRAFT_11932 [Conidiobolus coronatus NRRL 28638]|eukprot:KXN66264.1 hypothetical protein CONCODRAFT_11932 [Conidiobolus coronatus NRRL 28638]
MIFIILLYLNYIVCSAGISHRSSSSIVRNNKLYVYETRSSKGNDSSITIYNLEDGPILEIKHTEIVFNAGQSYTPQFIDLPSARDDDLWLIGGLEERSIDSNELNSDRFTSQFINDSQFKFNPSLIPLPKFSNFPKGGYSQVIVNENDFPVLYVIGGFIYDSDINNQMLTNYFFKFDFKAEVWTDLSSLTKSILPPIANHQTIVVNNEYLLVANGLSSKDEELSPIALTNENTAHNFAEKLYKFDLTELKWSTVHTKQNLNEDDYEGGNIYGASLDYYNGKVISYAALHNAKLNQNEPRIALLDLKTWEWEWITVNLDVGIDNSLVLMFHQTLLVSDQLVLIHGISNQKTDRRIFVIDLKDYKFKSTLNYSGNYGQPPKMPTYIIIIISVVCALAVVIIMIGVWLYLRNKNSVLSNNKSDIQMQEVWSGPSPNQYDNGEYNTRKGHLEQFNSLNRAGINNIDTSTSDPEANNPDETVLSLAYFQHEVDLKGMEDKELYFKRITRKIASKFFYKQ